MSLQGPILVVGDTSGGALTRALTEAGAFPLVTMGWASAPSALSHVKPSAIVAGTPEPRNFDAAVALSRQAARAVPFIPMLMQLPEKIAIAPIDALPIAANTSAAQMVARLSSALRVRTLHSTVLGRARTLKAERNIVAELPGGDPLDDACVLLVGRGRHYATLSVAVGERMGVIGALSIDTATGCLKAREVDGILIGDGLPSAAVETFLASLANDPQYRDLPVAALAGAQPGLPNFIHASEPLTLLHRALPLIRLRAFETALKRLLQSIECKGMLDVRTGLLNAAAFGDALRFAIDDAQERGTTLSLARFAFDAGLDRRTSLDAARLVSRLVRDTDFACRQDDGTVLFVFGDTDLRDAHVAARRLASVLKHTMLHPDRDRPNPGPSVTLATLKPADTAATLLARVAPRPVAAA